MTTELKSPVLSLRLYATMNEIEITAMTPKRTISIMIDKIEGMVYGDKRFSSAIADIIEGIAQDIREFAP